MIVALVFWTGTLLGEANAASVHDMTNGRHAALCSSRRARHHRTRQGLLNARLFEAVKNDDFAGAEKALLKGTSPNALGYYSMTPLLWTQGFRTAELLLDHGADPNRSNKGGVTPVRLAAQNGDMALTTLLVEHGAEVNSRDSIGQFPLLWVAFYGYIEIADYLIQHGADVNAHDHHGQTPLSMAAGQHRDAMIIFLKNHGATEIPHI